MYHSSAQCSESECGRKLTCNLVCWKVWTCEQLFVPLAFLCELFFFSVLVLRFKFVSGFKNEFALILLRSKSCYVFCQVFICNDMLYTYMLIFFLLNNNIPQVPRPSFFINDAGGLLCRYHRQPGTEYPYLRLRDPSRGLGGSQMQARRLSKPSSLCGVCRC